MSQLQPSVADFLQRCDALGDRLQIRRSTLSTRIFGDGKSLDQLWRGRDIGVRRLSEAEAALAEQARLAEAGRDGEAVPHASAAA